MELVFKISLILVSVAVLYEDIAERKTYWFWFPLLALVYSLVHLNHVVWNTFIITTALNLIVVGLFFLVIYGYAKFKLKVSPKAVFGLGDALLFLALAFTFSTISFITVFVFALVFALVIHLVFKAKSKYTTVPLAGYMSLFFAITYLASWFNCIDSLYII